MKNVDESSIHVLHAQVLMQSIVFLNDQISTWVFNSFLMCSSG
ncbi:hypothetical protein [Candidatus Enterovibrio escicola]|nr:hypothetical protein [Candidatus Enterovibrio escacola]